MTTIRRSWLDDAPLLTALLAEANQVIKTAKARGGKADERGNASLNNLVIYVDEVRVPEAALKKQVQDFLVDVQDVGNDITKKRAIEASSRFK